MFSHTEIYVTPITATTISNLRLCEPVYVIKPKIRCKPN